MKFIDEVSFTVSSGKGGAGAVSFRKEALAPRGGPDGGDGGRGGHIFFRVDTRLHSLLEFRFKKKLAAGDGQPGRGRKCTGADGKDLVLKVPPGTLVKDPLSGKVLADLRQASDHLFLKGGRGGKGNWFFRSSVNQAPEHAQPGEPGVDRQIRLELKLIADVGVIGCPNAGKSTLISALSAARPKIADYPFTTLHPQLGVVRVSDERSFVIADIPGLIPGAHRGVGLGTKFLRHIERTHLLVHLIDASESSGRDSLQDFQDINFELREYDRVRGLQEGVDDAISPLSAKPQLVTLNKIDLLTDEQLNELVGRFRQMGVEPLPLSAVTRSGLIQLVNEISKQLWAEERREHFS